MSKISSLAQSAIAIIAGLSTLNPTRIQAYTPRDEVIASLPPQRAITRITSSLTELQEQPSVEAQLNLTSRLRAYLVAESWWQKQVNLTQNTRYDACLFGDSISSSLGNTLGNRTFNFAMGGMNTTSLVAQLKALASANVKCQSAIIAMGTNDADSSITNDNFIKNLKQSISLVQGMGATKVFLIPAFYSTVEASYEPSLAGSISKIEEINALIRQVAVMENAVLFEEDIQPLYQGQALRKDLTTDGVHLNADGQNIYRQAILKILNSSIKTGLTNQS